ncbi:hypothetical protein M2344_001781 [Sphingobium sp. B8D3C]|nr:hypothetical protein [Sphingobium sp. B8D3C]
MKRLRCSAAGFDFLGGHAFHHGVAVDGITE